MPTHHQLQRIIARNLYTGTMPGYCTTPGCSFSALVDLEETRGYCPCCDRRTVTSALVL